MMRPISATLYRGKKKEKIWVRYYSWLNTALPRAVQLTMTTGEEGDVVEFASQELGFQIAVLHVRPKNRIELEYSELVKHSPSLMKLLGNEV